MSLIECGECGNEISSYAPKCVHCGYPIAGVAQAKRMRRIVAAVLAVTVLTAIVLARDCILRSFEQACSYAAPLFSSAPPADTSSGATATATARPVAGTASSTGSPAPLPPGAGNATYADALNAGDNAATGSFSVFGIPSESASSAGLIDAGAIIRHVIARNQEIYESFHKLDYQHFWTAADIDVVAGCDTDRRELLYALSALYLVDRNPDFDTLIQFLRLEQRVATTVIDYYRDMLVYRYAQHDNAWLTGRLQKAFSDVRAFEEKLEKYGWTKVYSKWGQSK